MPDGRGYRSRLLQRHDCVRCRTAHCHRPLETTWLTYLPDATIVGGEALIPDDLHDTAERVCLTCEHRRTLRLNTEGVRIRVADRMTEDADWD
jgi:hypothetical protein